MQGAIVQQRLTAMSLEATEVLVEVARELNSIVILEGLVQQLHQTVEGIALLHILQRESFHNLPGCSTQAGDQVEDTFRLLLQQLHLGHVEGYPSRQSPAQGEAPEGPAQDPAQQ